MDAAQHPPDHRSLTGDRRRDAMRRRLIEAGIVCAVEKGAGDVVIGDVTEAARSSRGTFYNYFPSVNALMQAACMELRNELIGLAFSATSELVDPVERVAVGGLSLLSLAPRYKVLGRFVGKISLTLASPQFDLGALLLEELQRGIAQGDLPLADSLVAYDFVQGALIQAVARLSSEEDAPPDAEHYSRQTIAAVLRGLGLSFDAAEARARGPVRLLVPPEGGILERAQQSYDAFLAKRAADAAS